MSPFPRSPAGQKLSPPPRPPSPPFLPPHPQVSGPPGEAMSSGCHSCPGHPRAPVVAGTVYSLLLAVFSILTLNVGLFSGSDSAGATFKSSAPPFLSELF